MIVICFIYGRKYFLKTNQIIPEDPEENQSKISSEQNKIVEKLDEKEQSADFDIYMNKGNGNWEIVNKDDPEYSLEGFDYYISCIFSYFKFFWTFEAVERVQITIGDTKYDEKITINSRDIIFADCVIFYKQQNDDNTEIGQYDIYFFEDQKIKNIELHYSEPVGTGKKPYINIDDLPNLRKLNSKIQTAAHLEEFFTYFITLTKTEIERNQAKLIKNRDPIELLNQGLTCFPTLTAVKEWRPKN